MGIWLIFKHLYCDWQNHLWMQSTLRLVNPTILHCGLADNNSSLIASTLYILPTLRVSTSRMRHASKLLLRKPRHGRTSSLQVVILAFSTFNILYSPFRNPKLYIWRIFLNCCVQSLWPHSDDSNTRRAGEAVRRYTKALRDSWNGSKLGWGTSNSAMIGSFYLIVPWSIDAHASSGRSGHCSHQGGGSSFCVKPFLILRNIARANQSPHGGLCLSDPTFRYGPHIQKYWVHDFCDDVVDKISRSHKAASHKNHFVSRP